MAVPVNSEILHGGVKQLMEEGLLATCVYC